MKFINACTLFLACLSMHLVNADLNRCFRLKELSPDRKTGKLLLSKYVLSDFHNKDGDCQKVVHADSIKINGVCNDVSVHKDNLKELKTCFKIHPNIKSDAFIRCRWNKRNVISQSYVSIGKSYSGRFEIKLYDKAGCELLIEKGTISTVQKTDANSISKCLKARYFNSNSKLELKFKSFSNVLSQFRYGWGTCGNLVRARSALVNNVCHKVSFYTGGKARKAYCKKHLKNGNYNKFKRCVWTKATVSSTVSVPAPRGKFGNEVNVQLFLGVHCSGKIASGSLVVA